MAKKLFALIVLWFAATMPALADSPTWATLTAAEKQALAPIAGEFDRLPESARRRFQGAAQRYPQLSPGEQQRFQGQLNDWARMRPEERDKARERFKEFQELPPEKRKEVQDKWRQQEEKKRAPQ